MTYELVVFVFNNANYTSFLLEIILEGEHQHCFLGFVDIFGDRFMVSNLYCLDRSIFGGQLPYPVLFYCTEMVFHSTLVCHTPLFWVAIVG